MNVFILLLNCALLSTVYSCGYKNKQISPPLKNIEKKEQKRTSGPVSDKEIGWSNADLR